MFERFTDQARQVVVLAQDESRALKHGYIGAEHLLLGLLREEEGLAARVLASFEIAAEDVRAQVARIVGEGDEPAVGQIPFTPSAKTVLELSLREALSLGHQYVGTEHILLGVVRVEDDVAGGILLGLGADPEKIRDEIIRMLSGPGRRQGPRAVPVPLFRPGRREYEVKTLEGGSVSWASQLAEWQRDGWELVAVVPEGAALRAILERRI
jgi:ATP-dependent Clp protease ATP-binding subunit ClpC